MHTAEAARGRGIGRAMLAHLLARRTQGFPPGWSLETRERRPHSAPAGLCTKARALSHAAPFAGLQTSEDRSSHDAWTRTVQVHWPLHSDPPACRTDQPLGADGTGRRLG